MNKKYIEKLIMESPLATPHTEAEGILSPLEHASSASHGTCKGPGLHKEEMNGRYHSQNNIKEGCDGINITINKMHCKTQAQYTSAGTKCAQKQKHRWQVKFGCARGYHEHEVAM